MEAAKHWSYMEWHGATWSDIVRYEIITEFKVYACCQLYMYVHRLIHTHHVTYISFDPRGCRRCRTKRVTHTLYLFNRRIIVQMMIWISKWSVFNNLFVIFVTNVYYIYYIYHYSSVLDWLLETEPMAHATFFDTTRDISILFHTIINHWFLIIARWDFIHEVYMSQSAIHNNSIIECAVQQQQT